MRYRPGLEWFLVGAVIAAGVAFRWADLDSDGFWCDEAESSINALTILQHGYPTDHYLGLPIYENTLVRPWPDNPEYEFRDASYSDKGAAIYHGWLPLYAIAGSFALQHIHPEGPLAVLDIRYGLEEWKRRTKAGRFPSVLFGGLFLGAAFVAGRALYGRDAAWIALLSLTLHPLHVAISRQARYYSATVAISTGCCLMVWLMLTKSRWRDFIIGGFLFTLLFHTHLLSFAVAITVFGASSPIIIYRNRRNILKIAAFGSIVAAGTIPWIFLTDFYQNHNDIPRGWSLLSLPGDLLRFPPARPVMLAIPFLFLLLILIAWASPSFPARLKAPLLDSLPPLLFLGAWAVIGYVLYLLFMPAASFFRNNMSYWGPDHLVIPVIAASAVRALTASFRRNPSPLAEGEAGVSSSTVASGKGALSMAAVAAGLLLLLQSSLGPVRKPGTRWIDLEEVASRLREMNLKSDSRLYTSPTDQLVLSFYTGLPFQSIAPIRKSFLDRYPGDVVIVQRGIFDPDPDLLKPKDLQTEAFLSGRDLSLPDAEKLSVLLRTHEYRQTVIGLVTGAAAAVEDVPPFAAVPFGRYEEQSHDDVISLDIMTRDFRIKTPLDWLEVFFYRFVDPDSRRGPRLNYAARLRGATALVLTRSATVIYRSPGRTERDGNGIDFTLIGSNGEFRWNGDLALERRGGVGADGERQ